MSTAARSALMYLSTKCISRSESFDNIYCLYFRYCHSEGEMLRRLADSLFMENNSGAERATIEMSLISSSAPVKLASPLADRAFNCQDSNLARSRCLRQPTSSHTHNSG